jgi:hypothetical protein
VQNKVDKLTENNPLVALLLHVKNRPKRYVTSKEDATGNETFASYANRLDIFIDELVGKTHALSLSLGKEPALRKRFEDLQKALEQKSKTEERIWYDYEKEAIPKIPNPLVSPHIPKYIRERAGRKWVPLDDVKELLGEEK